MTSSMPHHNDVLYLVVQYLHAKGLFVSCLTLQQESGVDVTWLRGHSHEVALLRRWVFAGDVEKARALLQPLKNLNPVPDELSTALMALDDLEMVTKTHNEYYLKEQPRLARAKLKCFEMLVPLFRAPVDVDNWDAFKYVGMPKLQLAGLVRDAVLFHRQTDAVTARDCISLTCTGKLENAIEERSELLLLDDPHYIEPVLEERVNPAAIGIVAHSVEWTKLRRRHQDPVVLSMSLNKCQWEEEMDDEKKIVDKQTYFARKSVNVAVSCEMNAKETTDAAVSCALDVKSTVDVAVSCALDVKSTVDIAVGCGFEVNTMVDAAVSCAIEAKETNEVAVSCGASDWSDVATQTAAENLLHFNDNVGNCCTKDRRAEAARELESGKRKSNGFTFSKNVMEDQSGTVVCHCPASVDDPSVQYSAVKLTNYDTPEAHPEASRSRHKAMPIEDIPLPDNLQQVLPFEADSYDDKTLLKMPLQSYDNLTLNNVVCASTIAEAKEPQAVRALGVHPNGTQLAIGTNARALRVFDLSVPLQQRQMQTFWSPQLNLILPLLPVVHERHKYHDSGIYCVSYNHHLVDQAGTASMIASGAADGSVKVLVTRDKESLQQTDELWIQRGDISGSMGKTRALEFASSHLLWVTSTNDRRLCCWDIRRSHKNSSSGIVQTLDGHVGEIQAIAMPAPPTLSTSLLSAALDKTVRLWDIRSRRCESLVTCGAHPAFSLHFHPTDEKLVVSAHQDGSVSLWDLRSTTRGALQVVVPHQDECRSVQWSPGGQWLLSAAFDGTLCIMQATNSTMRPIASFHKHYGKVLQAQWHPTKPAFISSGADKRVKLWTFD